MPKIHEYVNGRGLYIKARHKGKITTYQVSLQGEQVIRNRGLMPGSIINSSDLLDLINRGLIYTNNSGPGELHGDRKIRSNYSLYNEHSEIDNKGCLIITILFVVFLLLSSR